MRQVGGGAVNALTVMVLMLGAFGAPDRASEASGTPQEVFKMACSTLPFESIKKARQIDQECGIHGDANRTSDPAQAVQNCSEE